MDRLYGSDHADELLNLVATHRKYMNTYSRRAIIGLFAGALGSSLLAITLHSSVV